MGGTFGLEFAACVCCSGVSEGEGATGGVVSGVVGIDVVVLVFVSVVAGVAGGVVHA